MGSLCAAGLTARAPNFRAKDAEHLPQGLKNKHAFRQNFSLPRDQPRLGHGGSGAVASSWHSRIGVVSAVNRRTQPLAESAYLAACDLVLGSSAGLTYVMANGP